MKIIKILTACFLAFCLTFLPVAQPIAMATGESSPISNIKSIGTMAVGAAGTTMAIASTVASVPPIIIAGGAILIATGAAYTVYKAGKVAQDTALTVIPYAVIPLVNKGLASQAVKENKPGALDLSLSFSDIFKRIPYVGSWFGVNLNNGELHNAIENDHQEVANVLIQRRESAGVNLDQEHEGKRPLHVALQNDRTDEISQRLIQEGAKLGAQGKQGAEQNLFNDVVHTGKEELIHAALASGDATELMMTPDKEGNNVLHHAAVSPGLREIVKTSGVEPSDKNAAYNAANKKGKTPEDLALHKYFTRDDQVGHKDTETLEHYIDMPATVATSVPLLAKKVIADDDLVGKNIPLQLIDKKAIEPNLPDAKGHIAVDYAIARGDDHLAEQIAQRTDAAALGHKQYSEAILHGLDKTAAVISDKLGLATDETARLAFYNRPMEDDRTILAHMVEDPKSFNKGVFLDAYGLFKKRFGASHNPLAAETAFKANLLHSAALAENQEAVEVIFDIMKEEGFFNHVTLLTAESHTVVPALIAHGQGGKLTAALEGATDMDKMALQMATMGAQKSGHLVDAPHQKTLAAPKATPMIKDGSAADDDGYSSETSEIGDIPPVLIVGEDGKTVAIIDSKAVVVSDKYIAEEQERRQGVADLDAYNKKREAARQKLREKTAEEGGDDGVPDEIKTKHIVKHEKPRYELQNVKESALLGGYFATNIIDNREGLSYVLTLIPGVDNIASKETIQESVSGNEMIWSSLYFVASLAMSWGSNQNTDLFSSAAVKSALLNTSIYSAKRYFQPPKDNVDLPEPNERSTMDFIKRYGPSMARNMAWTALKTGALVYCTGATLGLAGLAVPAMTSLGNDFLSFYHAYNKDTEEGADKEQSWDSYLTPYIIATIATAGYFTSVSSLALQGVGTVSTNMQIIQNLMGGLVAFGSTHRMASLVYENFGKPAVDSASGWTSWAYNAIFGSSSTEPDLEKGHGEL